MPTRICGVGIVSVLGRLASCEAGTLLEKVSIVHWWRVCECECRCQCEGVVCECEGVGV